jgi:hypothetical protein
MIDFMFAVVPVDALGDEVHSSVVLLLLVFLQCFPTGSVLNGSQCAGELAHFVVCSP